ncbi:MAG: prephenate dehydrogenase [Anaerolineae bacterium]|nr:prephenate dehydrogenase [Anaerolineae bacterium]
MSVSKPRISIVGLGLIGGSIGLALRQAEATSVIVGHDRDRMAGNEAKKLGAVDKVHWNLISACEDADLVILAIPLAGIEDTLAAIGPHLRPGCVVMDTAAVKQEVMGWAAKSLPEGMHFVGTNPIPSRAVPGLSGIASARADLFQNGMFCIVPSSAASPDAVKLVTNLVGILEARPLFLDAVEHDGLVAAVSQLPGLLSLALLETAVNQPAWRELRKVAGPVFDAGTRLATSNPAGVYLSNQENLLRWIDALSASLDSVRKQVANGDEAELSQRIQQGWQERQAWMADREIGDWSEGPKPQMPARGGFFDMLFGGFLRRAPKQES